MKTANLAKKTNKKVTSRKLEKKSTLKRNKIFQHIKYLKA